MVILNGLKYACETCIKGHRSSACSHTERTLYEIKKKGRPITQCEHCRALRKTRQVHVKCTCAQGPNSEKREAARPKLKIPIPPHVQAEIQQNSNVSTAVSQGTDFLKSSKPKTNARHEASNVKPCACDSSGRCDCATVGSTQSVTRSSPSATSSGPRTPPPTSSCCSDKRNTSSECRPQLQSTPSSDKRTAVLLEELARSVPSSSNIAAQAYQSSSKQVPLSTISSPIDWHAGKSGACSCGVTCACSGCVEHASPSSQLTAGDNCPFTCTTCTQCSNGYTSSAAAYTTFPSYVAAGPSTPWIPSYPSYEMWYPSDPDHLAEAYSAQSSATIQQEHASSSKCSCTAVRIPAQIVSTCCSGSCKCGPIIVCQCAAACCGCCDGCSCPSDGEKEDPQPRLGFAVSGERSSGPPLHSTFIENARKEPPDGVPYPRKKKRRVDMPQGLEADIDERVPLYAFGEYQPTFPHSSSLQVIPSSISTPEYSHPEGSQGSSHTDRWLGPVPGGFHYKS